MLSPGNILHIKDFVFSDGTSKDKYLIVLCRDGEDYVVINLPSSQVYVNSDDIKEGCISNNVKHCYHFPAKKVIGQNGFAFSKSTFVYYQQTRPVSVTNFDDKYIETKKASVCDTLTDSEYKEFIYCAYKGIHVTKRVKIILEKCLEDLFSD